MDAKGGDMCAHGTGSTHMATDACTPIAIFETSPKARMGQPAPTHCSVEFELAGEERERNDALADAEACTTGGLAHCEVSLPELAADARTTTPSSVGSSVDSIGHLRYEAAEGLDDIPIGSVHVVVCHGSFRLVQGLTEWLHSRHWVENTRWIEGYGSRYGREVSPRPQRWGVVLDIEM